jgi:AbrB family looped-hinge helix DNA binding protein
MNEQGRIVIPADLRCAAGLEPGTVVIIRAVGDHLEIFSEDTAYARLLASAARVPRGSIGVVEELIAEHRAQAAKESRG